jgi:hypothetical protein
VGSFAASLYGFLPGSLAGEDTITDRDTELRGVAAVPEFDVPFYVRQSLFRLGDVPREVADFPSNVALLVRMNGTELVELADFGVNLDLLDDGRIAGRDRLNLGVRESATVEVLCCPDRRFAAHNLLDKACLGFQRLPHIRVEGALCHIAVDLNLFVRIALSQDSPLTLLDIARAPRRVEVMECHKPSLHVGAGTHLFRGAEKYPHSARIDAIKEHLRQRHRFWPARLLAGRVAINGMLDDQQAPFGGFKHSGVGREFGTYGIEAFLEPKAVLE